jgi:hypothetical protein
MASLSGFRRRELRLGGGDGVEDLGMTVLAAADGPQVGPVRLGHRQGDTAKEEQLDA